MTGKMFRRTQFLCGAAIFATALAPVAAFAQNIAGEQSTDGLSEIIVTAQKRNQSMQDVPIAVTAITQDSLQANRIHTVNDLSAIAPGLTVKPSAGGIQVPAFTMRGQVSFGVVAGSDKQVSIYLDGVYIASPRGSIFDLPDTQRLEVLRGPQGTLFGRNATAGAISITTRDPTGEAHMHVEGSYGNYDAYRVRVTAETPQVGPLSAYFSYVRDYRRGEIENSAAGLAWDRTNTPSSFGKATSPRWLGTIDSNSYFAAVKFQPSDSFTMVYKFDRNDDHGTPEGTALAAYDKAAGGGLFGAVLTALYSSNDVQFAPSGRRPDIVANGWVVPRQQRVQGHNLTATWRASDSITVKNVFAYRQANVFSPSAIDGVGTLTYTQPVADAFTFLAAASELGPSFFALPPQQQAGVLAQFAPFFQGNVGQRFAVIDSQSTTIAKQWSDELQANYASDKLQLTVGAIWFHSKDEAGGPIGQQEDLGFVVLPQTGIIPLGNEGRYFNSATSWAAYGQLEYKVTPQLEVVAGGRVTRDRKSAAFRYDIRDDQTGTVSPRPLLTVPDYSKTKPNFLVGLNWKPNHDTLVYAKYSTSFVSGGTSVGLTYAPETARSVELGLKAGFFDNRLRTNLALFHVDYNHFQSPQALTSEQSTQAAIAAWTALYGAATAQDLTRAASTFVLDQGKVRAQGFELEVMAAPTRGLTLGGSLGYTDTKFPYINPLISAPYNGRYDVTSRPKWTASLYGAYETLPLIDSATLQLRVDGQYRSSIRFAINPDLSLYADGSNAAALGTKGFVLVNSRLALRHLKIGSAEAELALWGKNLTNRKDATFALFLPSGTALNYLPPRTFGIELGIDL